MTGRHNAARGRVRAVLVGSVVALAALASMPVRAAAVAPKLVDSSVESGWSKSDQSIRATFDIAVKLSASSAIVTDGSGTVVATDDDCGLLKYQNNNDFRTLEFVAAYTPAVEDCRFQPSRDAYTISITTANLTDVKQTVTEARSFRVDTLRPENPRFEGESPQVLQEDEKATVVGSTKDGIGLPPTYSTDGTSGIALVVLRFYNPAISTNNAVASKTTIVEAACPGGVCPLEMDFAEEVALEPGVWTVKAQAHDLAGNMSSESVGNTYIVLPA